MNSTLHGNDLITKDNMDLVKDYLNSNFTSVSVDLPFAASQPIHTQVSYNLLSFVSLLLISG